VFSRSSGPGGQAVNKISSKATLRLNLADIRGLSEQAIERLRRLAGSRLTNQDDLLISCETSRSQHDNKAACMERLHQMIAQAQRTPKVRKKVKPSRGMVERRLESKRRAAQKKGLRRSRRSGGDDL
jgi:ribosome-associated protein